MDYHIPVLSKEIISGLNIRPDGIYVDLTFGGGGHSLRILEKLGKKGKLLAFDQDRDASRNNIGDPRFTLINSNFRFLRNFMKYYSIGKIDGVLADLGISSHQVDIPERGFSFMRDGILDMRMNQGKELTATYILNHYDEQELSGIFYGYGDLKNSRLLAARIVSMRKIRKIESTLELVEGLSGMIPYKNRNKTLAKVFQALRIEVNDEMGALRDLLVQLPELVSTGGRLTFLTYHSLEDRLVKNFLRSGNLEGSVHKDFYGNVVLPFKLINRKIITPDEDEIKQNPRSRSARLRIAEKT